MPWRDRFGFRGVIGWPKVRAPPEGVKTYLKVLWNSFDIHYFHAILGA
jgi:hypothetical protein